MKRCSYCGRESEESSMSCRECGTELCIHQPSTGDEDSNSPLSSNALVTLKSIIGVVLISTGVYFTTSRVFFDLQELTNGGPIGKLGIYAVGILFLPFWFILAVGSFIFTLVIFCRLTEGRFYALIGAIVSLAILALFFFRPRFGIFLPASLMGKATGLSIVGHFGSALQLTMGAWLLGWFARSKWKSRSVNPRNFPPTD